MARYQDGTKPVAEPPATDYADQEANQFQWLQGDIFLLGFYLRAELEGRAGGNPSWNNGINYRKELARSPSYAEVKALYLQAGLDLNADLKTLNSAAQITANAASLNYLSDNIILNGQTTVPVLGLHTDGDGLVVPQSESAYEDAFRGAGTNSMLRRAFVHRAGHCAFTSGETIAAFEALVRRISSGRWSALKPLALNTAAQNLGNSYNPFPPAYEAFKQVHTSEPTTARHRASGSRLASTNSR